MIFTIHFVLDLPLLILPSSGPSNISFYVFDYGKCRVLIKTCVTGPPHAFILVYARTHTHVGPT